MSNCALMLEWGSLVNGREMKALEEFMGNVAWWGEQKKAGKIGDFKVYLPATGAFGDRAGFVIFDGSDRQIAEFHMSEEFRVRLSRASLLVRNIQVNVCDAGDAIQARMQRTGKAIKDVAG
jgi:hypothetical protein